MKDLKFERKRSVSRLEAADQLTALAAALRKGGEAELELGAGTLSLHVPDEFRSEVELEIEDGEIELEIELKWSLRDSREPAKPSAAVTGGDMGAKRSAPKPAAAQTAKPAAQPVQPAQPAAATAAAAKKPVVAAAKKPAATTAKKSKAAKSSRAPKGR
ncbi:amphi-Trp domain-containing protein [Streptomyces gardneri]|uniref:amphi-Trp domain-containing protein n=1 Tax=Streptomyces gardneri TaxID=66892 RepID=UPI0036CE40C5